MKWTIRQNRDRPIESRLAAVRWWERGAGGGTEWRVKRRKLTDTDSSVETAGRRVDGGRVGRVKGGKQRLGAENTAHSVQTMCMELCTCNLYTFVNQCHPNKFNKGGKGEHLKIDIRLIKPWKVWGNNYCKSQDNSSLWEEERDCNWHGAYGASLVGGGRMG